jgi:hypothetical protein
MDNKNLFISAIISVSIYLSLVFLFVYYTISHKVKKIDSVSKTTVLQLDIVLPDPTVVPKKTTAIKESSNKNAAQIVKKSKSTSAKKRTNLKSLFANVSTKAPKVAKKTISNTKKSTIASRFKSKFEKERKVNNLTLSKLQNRKNVTAPKQAATESKNESDPYYSKIYDLMYKRWTPVIFNDDIRAKVLITITNNGTFSYQFIQYSDNIGFDNQLKEFLNEQTGERFPVNPNGKTTRIEILFQSKG